MTCRYLLFYKPYNVICQFSQTDSNCPTLKDYIDVAGVYPVGRLDQDSEGLLLLTDDGIFQHRLSDPRFHHPKTYWVQVEGTPDREQINLLSRGVTLKIKGESYRTMPAQVSHLEAEPQLPKREPPIRYRAQIPTSWLEITLIEGKNRQIRKMTAHVGLPTLRLVRVKIGQIPIGNLEPGQWRNFTPVDNLFAKSRMILN